VEFSRVGGPKLSERVVRQLSSQIVNGELRPGDRLPTEVELAELFGVSRSVIRDAVRTLAARRLVTVRQGYGMEVSQPSEDALGEALVLQIMRSDATLGDVMDARASLEIALGPLAARNGTDEEWDRMEAALDAFAAAVASEDWAQAHESHRAFHEVMLGALHSPVLEILLRPLHELILLSSLPPRAGDGALWDVEAHAPILAALRARDEQAVRDSLERHFDFRVDDEYAELTSRLFRDVPTLQDQLAGTQTEPAKPRRRRARTAR
jgi:GntR family transcriptional repressor for pyruvate dehydrogenase complex